MRSGTCFRYVYRFMLALFVISNVYCFLEENNHRVIVMTEPPHFSKQSIQVVVFDFGGVIAQANKQEITSFLRTTLDLDEDEIDALLKSRKRVLKHEINDTRFWRDFFCYHLGKNDTAFYQWYPKWEELLVSCIEKKPGMETLIKQLRKKGFQVALLSNTTHQKASILRKHGYYKGFHPLVLSCEIGADKPSSLAFKTFLDTAMVDPRDCLFVDDKPENVRAAREMGFDAVVFTGSEALVRDLAHRGIHLHEEIEEDYKG